MSDSRTLLIENLLILDNSYIKENINNSNFKRWFGNSKVVDQQGNPLVVYHGSSKEFDEFKFKDKNILDRMIGFHFAVDKAIAQTFTDSTGHIFELYLSIQNPIVIETEKRGADQDLISRKILEIASQHPEFEKLFLEWFEYVFETYDKYNEWLDEYLETGKMTIPYYGDKTKEYTPLTLIEDRDSYLIMGGQVFKDKVVRFFLEMCQKLGYDGVKYNNTSPVETLNAKDRTCYIAFFPEQIKSVYNNGEWSNTGKINEVVQKDDAWFIGNKLWDEKGNPPVLYHGSPMYGYFKTFKKGKRGLLGPGIYFTDDERQASSYAKKSGGGGVYQAHLRMYKPFIIEGGEGADTLLKAIYGTDSVFKNREKKQGNINYIVEAKDIRKLIKKGYDGIVWKNPAFNEYVVFSSSQIKLLDENGSWLDPSKILKESTLKIKKITSFKTDEGTFSVWDIDDDHRNRGDMFTVWEHPDGWVIRNALLPEELQQQNIGTNFYIEMNKLSLKKTKKPLRSSFPRKIISGETMHELSELGQKLWDSLVRKGYAVKLSHKNYRFK